MTGAYPGRLAAAYGRFGVGPRGVGQADQADEDEAAFQLLVLRQYVQPPIGDAEHAMAARGKPLACGSKVTACSVRERHRALILQPPITDG